MKTVISTVLSEYMELLTKTPYDCPLLVPPKVKTMTQTFIPGKDAALEDSISRFQQKLSDLGFNIEEASWLNPVPHVWSVHIRDRDCPLCFTNGKGASKKRLWHQLWANILSVYPPTISLLTSIWAKPSLRVISFITQTRSGFRSRRIICYRKAFWMSVCWRFTTQSKSWSPVIWLICSRVMPSVVSVHCPLLVNQI